MSSSTNASHSEFIQESEVKLEVIIKEETDVKPEAIEGEFDLKQELCCCTFVAKEDKDGIPEPKEEPETVQDQLTVANNGLGICCPVCQKHFFYDKYLQEHVGQAHNYNSDKPLALVTQKEYADSSSNPTTTEDPLEAPAPGKLDYSPETREDACEVDKPEDKLSGFLRQSTRKRRQTTLEVRDHDLEHHDTSDDRTISCSERSCKSKSNIILRKNTKEVHSNDKPFSCLESDQTAEQCHSRHSIHVHSEERPFSCTYCSHKSKRKSHLLLHMKYVHSEEKPFNCSECNYKAKTKGAIGQHRKFVHSEERPFNCPDCSYKSKTKQALAFHISSVHSEESLFSCPDCTYKFKTKFCLLQHSRRNHVNFKPFICSECDYKSTVKSDLVTHSRQFHSTAAENKRFCCLKCSFKVHDNLTLANHLQKNHSIKNYKYTYSHQYLTGRIEHLLRLQTKKDFPVQNINKGPTNDEETPLKLNRPTCTYTFKRRSDK